MADTSSPDSPAILLRKAELLGDLLDEDFAYFSGRSGTISLRDGEILFAAGSRADRFWVVASGSVVVERDREAIARFEAGDVVGDFDFARGASRDATAKSEGPSRLIEFPRSDLSLADLVAERPDASARILLRSITMISSRLRSVQKLISENDPWVRELRRQSHTDGPTGLGTRSFFEEELAKHLEAPSLFLMTKPDRFKELVDARGHSAGDAAMSAIASLLFAVVGECGRGHAIRIKSNETALVIPRCGPDEAKRLAQRLAQGFATLDAGPSCAGFHLSASMALGIWPDNGAEPSKLFDAVYGLLQRAWRDGGGKAYAMRNPAGGPPDGASERRHLGKAPA